MDEYDKLKQEQLNMYNDALVDMYKQLNRCSKKNIEYLKIIETYYKRIVQSEDMIDAKKWASRMIDHALQVTDIMNDDI